MSHNKLFEILGDDFKSKSLITNLSNGYMEVPYLIEETIKLLEDDNPYFNLISDSNKKSLCIMLSMYFDDCWGVYIEDLDLENILKFGKIEVYKVEASNGLRYATVNEIEQGIKGLIGEYVYPAGEKEYEYLSLLQWTFTGKSYYYRQAGYKLDYDSNGKVLNGTYEMIQTCALKLKEMFVWLSVREHFDKALKLIGKLKKSNGYKYATYEKDEITEGITIKQLTYNIYKTFPRNSTNNDYRKALALALNVCKYNKKLNPLEVSYLRDIYEQYAIDTHRGIKYEAEADEELKNKCEKLLNERYSGSINQKHFVYNIIGTLKKYNYTKCSPKQLSIIDDAFSIINKNSLEVNNEKRINTEVISDADIDLSLASLSDAIGGGLFEED